jgi:hypothetical protein
MAATVSRIRTAWTVHESIILRLAIVGMAIAAGIWLSYEFWRLLWQPGYWGAIDLRNRRPEVAQWVGGIDIYRSSVNALYPPATYVILWPLMGWLSETSNRWFWAITTLLSLGWLIWLIVEASMAETARERLLVALLPLSMYATGATIGNGQLLLHVMPFLVLGVLLLHRSPST